VSGIPPYHFPGARRILELPVYRCTEKQYYCEQKAQLEADFEYLKNVPSDLDPILREKRMKQFKDNYWLGTPMCPCDFNQVVAWVRLYGRPGAIGASLYIRKYTRIPRYFFRQPFAWDSNNFIDMWVSGNQSSIDIFSDLRNKICRAAHNHSLFRQKGWHIDMEVLDVLGTHLNWVELTRPSMRI
jgi:hypothetical protein